MENLLKIFCRWKHFLASGLKGIVRYFIVVFDKGRLNKRYAEKFHKGKFARWCLAKKHSVRSIIISWWTKHFACVLLFKILFVLWFARISWWLQRLQFSDCKKVLCCKDFKEYVQTAHTGLFMATRKQVVYSQSQLLCKCMIVQALMMSLLASMMVNVNAFN